MTADATVTVWVDHNGTTAVWTVRDALGIAAQILQQAGPHVYARTDLANAALLLAKVEAEEAHTARIRNRSMRGRRTPERAA
jgi:hypothetical protein